MEQPLFFKDWKELGGAALLTLIVYTAFIVFLRISGKRTLLKMNVFDFVVVVALGSTLAETVLIPDVTAAKGLVACATLIVVQFCISWTTTRSWRLEKFINGEPTLLMHRGEFLRDVMKKQRVTEEEIRAAIRSHGIASAEGVETVILETDGSFSVVWQMVEKSRSGLQDVAPQTEKQEQRKSGADPKK